jgi:hypothetical protein
MFSHLFLPSNHLVTAAQGQLSEKAGEGLQDMTSKHGNPRK